MSSLILRRKFDDDVSLRYHYFWINVEIQFAHYFIIRLFYNKLG